MAHKHEMVSGHIIPIVIDIIEWIEDNIFTALPVTAISRKSGYSHWYFQRQFALITGYTLGTYVSRRKMTIAAGILKQTKDSALSISLLLGFEGQATFCRTFRRHFGMSPTSYRRHPAQLEERMQYPLNLEEGGGCTEERFAGAAANRGQRLLTNGFWRHYAARADVVANPIIFA
ncbi:helix-turn-helix domain-containing protein [Klebsiella aerogenes]